VMLDNGARCMRTVDCKAHTQQAKREVIGRSRPYDDLLAERKMFKAQQQAALLSAGGGNLFMGLRQKVCAYPYCLASADAFLLGPSHVNISTSHCHKFVWSVVNCAAGVPLNSMKTTCFEIRAQIGLTKA
jgi:hypothetical protein